MTARVLRSSTLSPRLSDLTARAANWLTDLVFPPSCGNCGRVDHRFCHACLQLLSDVPIRVTRRQVPDRVAVGATGKHIGILQSALQSFKYEGTVGLAPLLAERIVIALRQLDWKFDAIVPVPLHAGRLQERGYNQSLLLSQQLEKTLAITCNPEYLARTRETGQQARLSEAERRSNVKDAFAAGADVAGKSILLVDDVVTTGSTLGECAVAVRAKGAYAVFAVAVSHA